MERKKLTLPECAGPILEALPKGILLTTKAGGKVNSMVIGWGTIGIEWSAPVFVAYVREGRHTRTLLDAHPEFTVNAPGPGGVADKRIIALCGGKSGRDLDKIAEAGLVLEEPEIVSVPAVRQMPLTLECRVVHRQSQDLSALDPRFAHFYPQDVGGENVGANRDPHVAYYGEIVSAYLLRD